MSDIYLAFIASALLSILLSFIQITADSKVYQIRCYFTLTFFFYVLIMIVGNVFTTLIAYSILENYMVSDLNGSQGSDINLLLKGPLWLWYAGFGVFGFEALIKGFNISFLDKDVLTINNWITRAKSTATSGILDKYADLTIERTQHLANQLVNKFSDNEIHSLATKHLGPDRYKKVVDSIKENEFIEKKDFLAQILSEEYPKVVQAEIKARKNNK